MIGSYPQIKLIVLAAHNLLRWVIVILAIYALVRLVSSWLKKSDWLPADQKAVSYFMIALDTQLMLGLLLYFVLSDLTRTAFTDFGEAMGNQVLRFFTVEHGLIMLLAITVANIANAAGKKDLPGMEKFKRVTILLGISVLLILAGIPWTLRPLLPVF